MSASARCSQPAAGRRPPRTVPSRGSGRASGDLQHPQQSCGSARQHPGPGTSWRRGRCPRISATVRRGPVHSSWPASLINPRRHRRRGRPAQSGAQCNSAGARRALRRRQPRFARHGACAEPSRVDSPPTAPFRSPITRTSWTSDIQRSGIARPGAAAAARSRHGPAPRGHSRLTNGRSWPRPGASATISLYSSKRLKRDIDVAVNRPNRTLGCSVTSVRSRSLRRECSTSS